MEHCMLGDAIYDFDYWITWLFTDQILADSNVYVSIKIHFLQ